MKSLITHADGRVRRALATAAAGTAAALTLGAPPVSGTPAIPDLTVIKNAGVQIAGTLGAVVDPLGRAYNGFAAAVGLDPVKIAAPGGGSAGFQPFPGSSGPELYFTSFGFPSFATMQGTAGVFGPQDWEAEGDAGLTFSNGPIVPGGTSATIVIPRADFAIGSDQFVRIDAGVSPGSIGLGTDTVGITGPSLFTSYGLLTPFGRVWLKDIALGSVTVDPVNGLTVTGPFADARVTGSPTQSGAVTVSTGTVTIGPKGVSATGTEVDGNVGGPTGTSFRTGFSGGVDTTSGGNGAWGSAGVQATSGSRTSPLNTGKTYSTTHGVTDGGGATGITGTGHAAGTGTSGGQSGFHSNSTVM